MELISVVVATKNSGRTLERCLNSIKQQEGVATELIVVDNHSTDATVEIGKALADKFLTVGPERSAQRNAGLAVASGAYVAFIDSDMDLSRSVLGTAAHACEGGKYSVAFPEISFGEGYWSRCKALERSIYADLPTVAAARFFRRDLLKQIGGYDEHLIGAEDWDLSLRAEKISPLKIIQDVIYHDEGRINLFALLRKKFYYGTSFRHFIGKHGENAWGRMGLSRFVTARSARILLGRPQYGVGVVAMKTLEGLATFSGALWGRNGNVEAIYK